MLLPNEPAVVLRRFSPKEDRRRVTAAAYAADLPGERVGFENHLNVVRSIERPMTIASARGLAAWLNSELVDRHLRARLGSTQVNAIELRSLPVPDMDTLAELGTRLSAAPELPEIDELTFQMAAASRAVPEFGQRSA